MRGSILGTDLDSTEPVGLPYQARDLGVTVLGQTGYGKTTLLERLICQDIAQGTAVIVVDAHGDLTQRILTLAGTDESNLLLLEAWEDAPFRLNLFDCPAPTSSIAVDRTVSGIVGVFKRLFGSPREFYPRLERDLGNATRTVLAIDGTLLDVPRLFWDAEFRAAALRRVTNPRVREFWALWERISRPDRQLEQLESTINRLDQFLGSEFVAQVVGSRSSTIPFDEVLGGNGRVLLLSLPVGEIGEGLCNLLGALFLAVLSERIFARGKLPPGERPRVHLYLDEYGRYATPTTAQLLTEGRKFGVGTTIAHQTRAQIPDEENRAAELQVGTLICFQLIGEDAADLSGEFRVTPQPQWEERVEEIEGEEPELAIPPKPVQYLLTSGHPDPVIRDIIRGFLAPLFERKENAEDEDRRQRHIGTHYEELKRTCDLVEEALAAAMEQRIDNVLGVVFRILTEYWDAVAPNSLDLPTDPRDLMSMSITALNYRPALPCLWMDGHTARRGSDHAEDEVVVAGERVVVVDYLAQRLPWVVHLYRCIGGVIERADAAIAAGGVPVFTEPDKVELAGELHQVHVHWFLQDKEPPEWFEEFAGAVGLFVCSLLTLLHRLAQEPLLIPTGRVRPRVRVRYITHPQRSYQDVQNELAVELASLPRFTVLCNIEGEQHRVRLAPPMDARIDQARIERVRQASKKRFGRGEDLPAESGPAGHGPAPSQVGGAGRARPIGRRSARGGPQEG
jgi:hypothetical protein